MCALRSVFIPLNTADKLLRVKCTYEARFSTKMCRPSISYLEKQQAQEPREREHSRIPRDLPTPRPGSTTVRPESESRIRILQAGTAGRAGSIRDAQREPAEEGTGAYREMQASIILQGRSVHIVLSAPSLAYAAEEVRRSLDTERKERGILLPPLSPPSLLFLALLIVHVFAPARSPAADLRGEMLRCKTVDCHGAVFSLCTAMVAVGVPGTTEGRDGQGLPHRALPRLCLLYFGRRVCVRARTYIRGPPPRPFVRAPHGPGVLLAKEANA